MKIRPIRHAALITAIDLILFSPLIIANSFSVFGDVEINYKIIAIVEPVWRFFHFPMHWLANDVFFIFVMRTIHGDLWSMHDTAPDWLLIAYYGLCFVQTFLIAFVALYVISKHKQGLHKCA